ncbi:7TM chemoreceptor [Necator americanus]|uniref:7TM chemoreceptor n=1 Tax=Necator americanus TaxID=51031 RepID=W2TE47_NECAM|nr:7TM chemoreceptor [Necator americanus]ETN79471.1 7TM chemoreceptor [Necator americanus]
MFEVNGYPLVRTEGRTTVELIFMFVCIGGIPLTLVALIIIFTKTPPQMTTYKWIIVNMTITTFLTDFIICFLFDPIPLFPDVACYSKAWLANVCEDANYILLCVSIVMLQLTLSSTLVAFLYRVTALGNMAGSLSTLANYEMKYTVTPTYLVGVAPVTIVLITSYKSRSEMRDVIERKPELYFLNNYGSYLVANRKDSEFIIFQSVWLCSAFLIVALCAVIAASIIRNLHEKRKSMSPKSLELHRSLVAHLIFQITIPAVTTLIPMVILFSTRYVDVPFGAHCGLEYDHLANGRPAQPVEHHCHCSSNTTLSQRNS